MRQIKFKGLRTDGKGWVYGDLATYMDGSPMIMPKCYFATRDFDEEDEDGTPVIQDDMALGGFFSVIPESLGQFTGLHDKNEVEIYEGDQFAPDTNNDEVKSVVRWDESFAKFVVDSYGYDFHIGEGSQEVYDNELSICDTADLGDVILEYCEVIGNIHTQDGGQEG